MSNPVDAKIIEAHVDKRIFNPTRIVTMGACLAVDEAAARSRLIDKQNKKDFNNERRIVKLLLLGTGKVCRN